MKCFNCQQEGHLARECTWEAELTPARPDPLALYRRDPAEISQDPHGWADKIRAYMGWPQPAERAEGTWETMRAIAARQVAESRATRSVLP